MKSSTPVIWRPNRVVHHLEGSNSNFEFTPAIAAVQHLETLGHEGNLEGADDALRTLRPRLTELREMLQPLQKKSD